MRDELVADRLYELGLTGERVPHSREKNLQAIDRLMQGDPFYTFAIRRVEAALPKLSAESVLAMLASHTGCSRDPAVRAGHGYIDPLRSARGIQAYAAVVRKAAHNPCRVVFATGHPGSLISLYQPLADYLRQQGCRILHGGLGEPVAERDWYLDFVGDVACVTDTCGLRHSHHADPMRALLAASGPADLAFTDHGMAGFALNQRIPTVALMDTNDPALAVTLALGEDLLVMAPLSDNAPNGLMSRLAELILGLARS